MWREPAHQNADETKFGLKITNPAGTVADETVFPIDYDVRLNAKTTIKKELYGMLKKRTGKELPWGTLTGIRPTKIAMTRLDQGEDEETIRSFRRTVPDKQRKDRLKCGGRENGSGSS